MLHILILILKIIGITLLCVLGIVLFLLSIVLFIPVKYKINLKNASVDAKAHWMFHILSAYYISQNGASDWKIRLGWKVFQKRANEVEDKGEENHEPDEPSERVVENEQKVEGKVKKKKTKKNFFEKFKCTIKKICAKIKEIWELKEKVTDFLTDPGHHVAFGKIKKEIAFLVKRVKPQKIEGYVKFGFEDPYHTGQMLALLSVLYPFYGEQIDIYPDFEDKIYESNIHMHGKMHVVSFVIFLWNLYFDKDVLRMYKNYKKIKP